MKHGEKHACKTGCQCFHTISSFSFIKNTQFNNEPPCSLLNDAARCDETEPAKCVGVVSAVNR